VCLTCCSRDVMVKIDQICHKNSVKFFTGDVFGYHGYMFADLGEHEFTPPLTPNPPAPPNAFSPPSQRVVFCQLKEALAVDWSGEKAKAALKRTAPDYFLLQ
ncbi:SAE1 enzyme, partial [Anhinga anhinga]|nr:SAE1 enzyme [Anhinga anhinga]